MEKSKSIANLQVTHCGLLKHKLPNYLTETSVISRHIKNIFTETELDSKSNLQNMQTPNSDKPTTLYSLNIILAIGYRVKSPQGTQFRQ
jgi:hypothetical protein